MPEYVLIERKTGVHHLGVSQPGSNPTGLVSLCTNYRGGLDDTLIELTHQLSDELEDEICQNCRNARAKRDRDIQEARA